MQLCGVNTECIFDTIIAGPEVGAQTLKIVEEFEEILEEEGENPHHRPYQHICLETGRW